jgi:hypothetical protein
MTRILRGTIRGRTVELSDDPGIEDGRLVEVNLRALPRPGACDEVRRDLEVTAEDATLKGIEPDPIRRRRLVALRAAAGSLAHLPDEDWAALDRIVAERQSWPDRGLEG